MKENGEDVVSKARFGIRLWRIQKNGFYFIGNGDLLMVLDFEFRMEFGIYLKFKKIVDKS